MDRIIFGTGSIFIFKNPKNRSETNLAEDQDIESIDWEFAQKEQQATLNIFKKKEQEEQDRKKQEERFLTSPKKHLHYFLSQQKNAGDGNQIRVEVERIPKRNVRKARTIPEVDPGSPGNEEQSRGTDEAELVGEVKTGEDREELEGKGRRGAEVLRNKEKD